MAVPAFLFVEAFSGLLSIGLGFAAGAMLWLVGAELVPDALETARAPAVALTVVGAALAMLVFLLLLL
jgi:zinc transporter ZupT